MASSFDNASDDIAATRKHDLTSGRVAADDHRETAPPRPGKEHVSSQSRSEREVTSKGEDVTARAREVREKVGQRIDEMRGMANEVEKPDIDVVERQGDSRDAAGNRRGHIQHKAGEAAEKRKDKTGEAKGRAKEAGEKVKGKAQEGRDRAEETGEKVKGKAQEGKADIEESAAEAKEETKKVLGLDEEQFKKVVKAVGTVAAIAAAIFIGRKAWPPIKGKTIQVKDAVEDACSEVKHRIGDVLVGAKDAIIGTGKSAKDKAVDAGHALEDAVHSVPGAARDARRHAGDALHAAGDYGSQAAHTVVAAGKDVSRKVQRGSEVVVDHTRDAYGKGRHVSEEAYHEAQHKGGQAKRAVEEGVHRGRGAAESAYHTSADAAGKAKHEGKHAADKAEHEGKRAWRTGGRMKDDAQENLGARGRKIAHGGEEIGEGVIGKDLPEKKHKHKTCIIM